MGAAIGTLAILCFAAAQIPLRNWLSGTVGVSWPAGIDGGHALFLLESLALIFICGQKAVLGPGAGERWRNHGLAVAIVFAVPPAMVLAIYATLTDKPYAGMTWKIGRASCRERV